MVAVWVAWMWNSGVLRCPDNSSSGFVLPSMSLRDGDEMMGTAGLLVGVVS